VISRPSLKCSCLLPPSQRSPREAESNDLDCRQHRFAAYITAICPSVSRLR
jgi:hypothetical protein